MSAYVYAVICSGPDFAQLAALFSSEGMALQYVERFQWAAGSEYSINRVEVDEYAEAIEAGQRLFLVRKGKTAWTYDEWAPDEAKLLANMDPFLDGKGNECCFVWAVTVEEARVEAQRVLEVAFKEGRT